MDIVKAIELALKVKSGWLWQHSLYVASVYSEVGNLTGIIPPQKAYIAGIIHDIGKILVPDEILNKPAGLTEREEEIIQQHPVWGVNEILDIESFSDYQDLVLYHHEKVYGGGYPEGIDLRTLANEIRLLHVIDRFCALTEDRPYRPRYSVNTAIKLIRNDLYELFPTVGFEIEGYLEKISSEKNKILCLK